ncbi:hypothetical protein ACFQH6_09695 [Halobacteriaceae archaeon GCM10025711]
MADVSLRPADDRGQVIIVAGLAIAVILVALVLLLNTVIYADNLATRGVDVGGGDALAVNDTVVDGVGGLIDQENAQGYDSATYVRSNVSDGITRIDTLLSRQYAQRGVVADVATVALHDGTLIRQTDATRNLTNASGASAWTLAENVEDTRGVVFTVDRSDLQDGRTGAFQVLVDGTDQWRAYIYHKTATNDIAVAVDTPSTAATEVCSVTASTATVDLTRGTINGTHCPGLEFAEGVSAPYTVEFVDSHQAVGTYNVTVNSTTVDGTNFVSDDSGPTESTAVYSAVVDVRYETPRLTYADRVRIAPGNRHDRRPRGLQHRRLRVEPGNRHPAGQ